MNADQYIGVEGGNRGCRARRLRCGYLRVGGSFVFEVAADFVEDHGADLGDGRGGVEGFEVAELGVVGDERGHGFLVGGDALGDDLGLVVIADDEGGAVVVADAGLLGRLGVDVVDAETDGADAAAFEAAGENAGG